MEYRAKEERKLLEVLQELSPDTPRTRLKSWVEQGRVSINGSLCSKASHVLKKGELLQVGKKNRFLDPALKVLSPYFEQVKILHEDSDLIVVDKPAGLLSVATDEGGGKSLHQFLKKRCNHPVYPVHRLDKETSGVLVFAYSSKARTGLKEDFFDHTIEREYYAILEGIPSPSKGTWKSLLVEDERSYFVRSHPTKGKLAITHYEIIYRNRTTSLVKFHLETGRKNQIRVHASEAGYPILGDVKYGSKLRNKSGRLCLHAHRLGFTHPVTGKRLEFKSPIPVFFNAG